MPVSKLDPAFVAAKKQLLEMMEKMLSEGTAQHGLLAMADIMQSFIAHRLKPEIPHATPLEWTMRGVGAALEGDLHISGVKAYVLNNIQGAATYIERHVKISDPPTAG